MPGLYNLDPPEDDDDDNFNKKIEWDTPTHAPYSKKELEELEEFVLDKDCDYWEKL